MISADELSRRLKEIVRAGKCTKEGCRSGHTDSVDVCWFGLQYPEKMLTCSSCFLMDDEAVKKSIPTAFNILPASAFISKFASEMKMYESLKESPKWGPSDLAKRQKEHLGEIESLETKLLGTLKALSLALEKFGKKAVEANTQIYSHDVFNEIIQMHTDDKMENVLAKLQVLINYLNIGEDGKYRFADQDLKNKRHAKLAEKIAQMTDRVVSVLDDLLIQLQEKSDTIAKV